MAPRRSNKQSSTPRAKRASHATDATERTREISDAELAEQAHRLDLYDLVRLLGTWAAMHDDDELGAVAQVVARHPELMAGRDSANAAKWHALAREARRLLGWRSQLGGVRALLALAERMETEHADYTQRVVSYAATAAWELERGGAALLGAPRPTGDLAERILAALPAGARRRDGVMQADADALVRATLRALGHTTSEADDMLSHARA